MDGVEQQALGDDDTLSGEEHLTAEAGRLSPGCMPNKRLASVAATVGNSSHLCRDWVRAVYGRVAQSGGASAVIWSLDTQASTGLLVSAVHTLGEGFFGAPHTAVAAKFYDASAQAGISRINLLSTNNAVPNARTSPMFLLFHPDIPAAETGHQLTRIRPEHDFYLAALDSQLLKTYPMQLPAPLLQSPPVIFDPAGRAKLPPTFAEAKPGKALLLLGFPMTGPVAGSLAYNVAVTLSDAQALAAVRALRNAGDEEGSLAYQPEAEVMVRGAALAGMSGGAAFDGQGRLVGILVRASGVVGGVQYVRIVRTTYIREYLKSRSASLSPGLKAAVAPFFERQMF